MTVITRLENKLEQDILREAKIKPLWKVLQEHKRGSTFIFSLGVLLIISSFWVDSPFITLLFGLTSIWFGLTESIVVDRVEEITHELRSL